MKNIHLPEVIKKLSRRSKKIIYADDLKANIASVMGTDYQDRRGYKIIYYLKRKGYLISLKKNIFCIKKPDEELSQQTLIEQRYRPLLHKHCSNVCGNHRYIGGFKALQIGFMDFSIPDEVQVVTQDKQRVEVVIAERTLHFKKYTSKKASLFKQFKKHAKKHKIKTNTFLIASKELAILEVLYNFDEFDHQYEYEYLKKALKKFKGRDPTVWEAILKLGKHHTSANRLHTLLQHHQPKVATQLMESIKKYGFVL